MLVLGVFFVAMLWVSLLLECVRGTAVVTEYKGCSDSSDTTEVLDDI